MTTEQRQKIADYFMSQHKILLFDEDIDEMESILSTPNEGGKTKIEILVTLTSNWRRELTVEIASQAMQEYASQQTEAKDREIEALKKQIREYELKEIRHQSCLNCGCTI